MWQSLSLAIEDDFLTGAMKSLKSGPSSKRSECKDRSNDKSKLVCKVNPTFIMDGTKLRKFNLRASILNDAFPHMLGLQPDWILAQGTNDMGLTHGFSFSSAMKIDGWNVVHLKLDKKLFTGHDEEKNKQNWERWRRAGILPEDAPRLREQLYTEEATYLLTWRHFMRDGEIYFDIGIGIQDLNRTQNEGFLNTAEQQRDWHKSRDKIPVYNNPTDRDPNIAEGISPILNLAIGKALSSTFIKNNWVRCTGDMDLNGFVSLSGNKGASLAGGSGLVRLEGSAIGHFLDRYILSLFAQGMGELIAHSDGSQLMFETSFGVDFMEAVSLGYRQRFFNGSLINYQTHNTLGKVDNGRVGEFFLNISFDLK